MKAAHLAFDFAQLPVTQGIGASAKKVPAVTSTIVVDDTAYISSSMKGGSFLYLPAVQTTVFGNGNRNCYKQLDPNVVKEVSDGAVWKALRDCQTMALNAQHGSLGHRNGGSCGEPMAAMAFCATHVGRDLKDAKIVSINDNGVVAPCADPAGKLVCFPH